MKNPNTPHKIIAFLAAAALLVSCTPPEQTAMMGQADAKVYTTSFDMGGRTIYRTFDKSAAVICYWVIDAGVYCLPLDYTNLTVDQAMGGER